MFACIYIPNASAETNAVLRDCAGAFSPRVENTSNGTVVFDAEGLERLFGSYPQIAEQVAEQVRTRGIEANVAVAANVDAAICAARGLDGISVINRGTEAARLQHLPLRVLSPSPEFSKRWNAGASVRSALLRNCRRCRWRNVWDRTASNSTNALAAPACARWYRTRMPTGLLK